LISKKLEKEIVLESSVLAWIRILIKSMQKGAKKTAKTSKKLPKISGPHW
jgi:hypothetical protein